MPTRPEIDGALLDVRKAYRLLSLYQRRVLDLCGEITGVFETTLNFYQWSPSHYDSTPRRGTLPLNRWAWDFLPLYDFCVLYLPEGVHWNTHNPGDWLLAIRISADSGYQAAGAIEPDPRDFRDPTSCESSVSLYVYYCSQAFVGNWFYNVYSNNRFPQNDGEGSLERGLRTFGMKFPLSEMGDTGAVQTYVNGFRAQLQGVFPSQTEW